MTDKEKLAKEQDIAREIGYFYFNRSTAETVVGQVEQATQEVKARMISRIDFDGNTISITTSRPGIIIGKRGAEIEALRDHLRKAITFDEICLIEDRVLGNLYSFQYALGLD
jgi:predicted RNA-binding protein YlqC (UPF0109 family)